MSQNQEISRPLAVLHLSPFCQRVHRPTKKPFERLYVQCWRTKPQHIAGRYFFLPFKTLQKGFGPNYIYARVNKKFIGSELVISRLSSPFFGESIVLFLIIYCIPNPQGILARNLPESSSALLKHALIFEMHRAFPLIFHIQHLRPVLLARS